MNTADYSPSSPKSHLSIEYKLPKFPEPLFVFPTIKEFSSDKLLSLSRNNTAFKEKVSLHPKGHVKLDFFTSHNLKTYQALENSPNSGYNKQISSQKESFDNTGIRLKYSISPEPIRNTSIVSSPIKRNFLTPNKAKPQKRTNEELEEVHKENTYLKEQLKKINKQLCKVLENSSNLYLDQQKPKRDSNHVSTQKMQKQLDLYE